MRALVRLVSYFQRTCGRITVAFLYGSTSLLAAHSNQKNLAECEDFRLCSNRNARNGPMQWDFERIHQGESKCSLTLWMVVDNTKLKPKARAVSRLIGFCAMLSGSSHLHSWCICRTNFKRILHIESCSRPGAANSHTLRISCSAHLSFSLFKISVPMPCP